MDSHDIKVQRGGDFKGLTIQFSISSTPVDLTNAEIKMQVKKDPCDTIPVLEFSTANNTILIDNPTEGIFSVEPLKNVDVTPRIYSYDIRIETDEDKSYYILNGKFEVEQTVTRK